ncbi:hypothetical protein ABZ154_05750 [Streptomyces sp. NPDC006261]|uniref:hypothetical protein n=1 Tax=Streptomyces sp. NPDC006261 TaxID=3156739 RepID=UPI0033B41555
MERGERLRIARAGPVAQGEERLHGEVAAGAGGAFPLGLRAVRRQHGRRAVDIRAGEEGGRQREDGVTGLGQPAVPHEHDDPQPVLVHQPVDGAGVNRTGAPGARGVCRNPVAVRVFAEPVPPTTAYPWEQVTRRCGVPPRRPSAAGQS